MNSGLWLRASDAHLLLECSKRWLADQPVSSGIGQGQSNGQSRSQSSVVGRVVHASLEEWFQGDDWCASTAAEMLEGTLKRRLQAEGLAITQGSVKVLRRHLIRRAGELRQWVLKHPDPHVLVEEPLEDQLTRLRGRVDLLVQHGDSVRLLEVKTGTVHLQALETQLAVYALILGSRRVCETGVFTPAKGIEQVRLPAERLMAIWDALNHRRQHVELSGAMAMPGPAVCRFCPIRASCSEHWLAVDSGLILDAWQGEVTRIEQSANGFTAVILQTEGASVTLTHLRTVPSGLAEGRRLAVLEAPPLTEKTHVAKKASSLTRLELLPA